ncbi:MAG: 3-dehydroquinate dehydratase [Thermoanaerobacteraceae bacterium]|jgi:3-dehydroquinate dehydratase-2|uniref:3-dehydroquinate dehydratase n=1 Tax=Biomaibacter acetigenes TaxID=2316383 RepID=A0A3G2R5A5_9FIRM|nr:type II 3-dehydroquinate dehydratase [Biomaibacter acetigenes]AYO30714.1 type II 3-dehydroquinate dehydratase [Biomaibacter acetigenes]MDK2878481.1 3-dehydroquinate dehydratase [Thermoanaerobacteraceae bacterium]MDN5302978.1 3-dehydroquinate dehydratase [Thermoanaerobacteraceae bacterium]MDN5312220.1 3-dehydroquinate dehydratase [Thermoanaerobacteraceae bacterium]
MKIKIINGPNLNLLGIRDKRFYGETSLDEINENISKKALEMGATVDFFQSNSEGAIIDEIQKCLGNYDGIIINPGGYTHYSVAIRDALEAVRIPAVEVHLSNIFSREDFRRKTLTGQSAIGIIAGLGAEGYILALMGLKNILHKREGI